MKEPEDMTTDELIAEVRREDLGYPVLPLELAARLESARGAMKEAYHYHHAQHHSAPGYCSVCHPLEKELSK